MFGLDKRSRTIRAATGPLAEFYRSSFPVPSDKLDTLPLLAVDVETTGLTPGKDRLLSIGWVPVDGGSIDLAGAGHVVLRGAEGDASVGDSATVHGLTDDAVAAGEDPAEAVARLLDALAGRVMLVHYAHMEQGFLGYACRRHFGADLMVPIVDTFAVERRHMERMGTYPRGEDLRLPRVRGRYGLPFYRSHNALTDALACAELYLALAANARGDTMKTMQP
ncbi:exonuclease domain-containing protein [Corynebacterium sp. TAE3-ERU16]|uniref:exonuclease domain-containing protein n=1 Tax=Corynebacterium sp. TAE3-ERU16 TaxID=2849493 RepID=UPI001C49652B|nr:exonuclease domain-containing protein [Corynebacterium sp. TAE3-ERU16]MBV7292876.1 3'-5' exonuclease [Corynebacterium sp. TAE3-ERU16]